MSPSPNPLPFELLLSQLEALDLCQSLFPLDNELVLSTTTATHLDSLRSTLSSSSPTNPVDLPIDHLSFTIHLTLAFASEQDPYPLSISIKLPLATSACPELTRITIHQPPWLSRSAHTSLISSCPPPPTIALSEPGDVGGYLMMTLDSIRDQATALIPVVEDSPNQEQEKDEAEVRVWYLFQSLSTREKRDDIVNWAKDYDLTGFVLAGKPAILCLEGQSSQIDTYMSEIKSVSWSDIPSFQKKVSERHRTLLQPPTMPRVFTSMAEITSLIDRGGHRGNRGEMAQVRDYLVSKGLGEAFGIVVGGGQFVS